tara:strand:- start:414 stop:836 length:423 start_codon:yes stop_codon:yes gene_type:complete
MKIFVKILPLLLFLTGCYQTSLAPMIGPAASASQGNLAYSAASTGLSYGIKHQTGKFPIEHVFQREKQKIVKKIELIETEIKDKSSILKNSLNKQKKAVQSKSMSAKTRKVLHLKEIKSVEEKDAFPANKPRYSYWSKTN